MKKSIWVLTRAINQYDQDGDYFEGVFEIKPTREQLLSFLYQGTGLNKDYSSRQHEFVEHLLKGGGRIHSEDEWYFLTEIVFGVQYKHS